MKTSKKSLLIVAVFLGAFGFTLGIFSDVSVDSNVIDSPEEDLRNLSMKLDTSSYEWRYSFDNVSTESTGTSDKASIAVDSFGNVHVVWEDMTNDDLEGDKDIYYKRWNATTRAWTTTEDVSSESTLFSGKPSIAVDNSGNVHVVWYDNTDHDGEGDNDIYYKRWNVTTGAWTTTEYVSIESDSAGSQNPSIAVDTSGNIHVAWEEYIDEDGEGDADIYYTCWNATLSHWQRWENVSSESTATSGKPSIAVDNSGNVHIVWEDQTNHDGENDWDIYYKRWNATSDAWTTTLNVSTESTDHSLKPSIAVDSSGIAHVVWEDQTDHDGEGDSDIYYKRWNATSSDWTKFETVSSLSTNHSYYPSITSGGSMNIHVVWHDETDHDGEGDDDIYYKRFEGLCKKWTVFEDISPDCPDWAMYASIAADSTGNVHVAYRLSPNYDILYKWGITGTEDSDGDGLTDWDEVMIYGTDPYKIDTDDDNYLDKYEIICGTDPLDPNDYPGTSSKTIIYYIDDDEDSDDEDDEVSTGTIIIAGSVIAVGVGLGAIALATQLIKKKR